MRTLQAKIRRRWPWGLAASPLVLAGLIAVPVATHASAGVNGPFTVTNAATGKCLDSNTSAASTDIPLMNPIYLGGDPDMGAVYAKSCNGGNYQNWTITITSSDPVNTVVTITDSQTGKCLDSNASADNPGDPDMGAVYAKSCNGGGYQQWGVAHS